MHGNFSLYHIIYTFVLKVTLAFVVVIANLVGSGGDFV